MTTFFVISDMMGLGDTGYWSGTEMVSSLEGAKRYSSLPMAESAIRDGDFYDPAIYEVEEHPEGLKKTRFIDMVNKYGRAGGH